MGHTLTAGGHGGRGILLCLAVACLTGGCTPPQATAGLPPVAATDTARPAEWWKGNLHAHSLWTDGDAYPELAVAWYRENGYHFLALSEHDLLAEGSKWIHPTGNEFARGRGAVMLTRYIERFGPDWVERRRVDAAFRDELAHAADRPPGPDARFARSPRPDALEPGVELVRLKPLDEFRHLFEAPGRFLLLRAEEIASTFSVHINATNVVEHTPARHGGNVVETIEANLGAVAEQSLRAGRPMLAQVNHPNFRWAITAEELAAVEEARFFELYNGHPLVANEGDDVHAGVERMWDIALTLRLAEHGFGVLYGLAVDDAHEYGPTGIDHAAPGRGWVQVRAPFLTPEHLIEAMERGDFYASTGVALRDISFDGARYAIEVEAEPGVRYRTTFIGTRRGYDPAREVVTDSAGAPLGVTKRYSHDIGETLAEVDGTRPTYRVRGDEIYIRASVVSDRPKANPVSPAEAWEVAWTQPVAPPPADTDRSNGTP